MPDHARARPRALPRRRSGDPAPAPTISRMCGSRRTRRVTGARRKRKGVRKEKAGRARPAERGPVTTENPLFDESGGSAIRTATRRSASSPEPEPLRGERLLPSLALATARFSRRAEASVRDSRSEPPCGATAGSVLDGSRARRTLRPSRASGAAPLGRRPCRESCRMAGWRSRIAHPGFRRRAGLPPPPFPPPELFLQTPPASGSGTSHSYPSGQVRPERPPQGCSPSIFSHVPYSLGACGSGVSHS